MFFPTDLLPPTIPHILEFPLPPSKEGKSLSIQDLWGTLKIQSIMATFTCCGIRASQIHSHLWSYNTVTVRISSTVFGYMDFVNRWSLGILSSFHGHILHTYSGWSLDSVSTQNLNIVIKVKNTESPILYVSNLKFKRKMYFIFSVLYQKKINEGSPQNLFIYLALRIIIIDSYNWASYNCVWMLHMPEVGGQISLFAELWHLLPTFENLPNLS